MAVKVHQPKKRSVDGGRRQDLCTPPALQRGIARELGWQFDLDVAATEENSLCPHWLSPLDDALAPSTGWHATTIWCNPPFNNIASFVEKASAEWRSSHFDQGALLLPARTDTAWFAELLTSGWRVIFLTGRVKFLDPESQEQLKQPFEGSLLWLPGVRGRVGTLSTVELMKLGLE